MQQFSLMNGHGATRGVVIALFCLFILPVQASVGGRAGFSGDPTTSGAACDACHAPGASTPTVTVTGPGSVDAGDTIELTVSVAGGPAQTAGVGVSAGDGIGTLEPGGADLRLLGGELTHSAPKPLAGGSVSFQFSYTAPGYDTVVTLYVAGNSTDGGLDLLGDGIGTTTHAIVVSNGFEPPPDPPAPPPGDFTPTLYTTGLESPVAIANAGDGRLFVVERAGRIRLIWRTSELRNRPFLDIADRVDDSGGEQGLLGLAFHPDYDSNGFFYVYYTLDTGAGLDRSRVSRFSVSSDNRNNADPDSERVLMEFEQPFGNHNAGDLHFGPDGYLYIASGDGGSGGDPLDAGQTPTTLLGKMLRIDVDNAPGPGNGPDCDLSGGGNYSTPADNAFADGVGGAGCDEIFALGLRNPWRFAFDRQSGGLWIADVGQNALEEVHYLSPGAGGGINLGWRCFEGDAPFNLAACDRVYLPPVHTASHADGNCSITGGRVYRGSAAPTMVGQYLFTDFCQGSIRALAGSPNDPQVRVVVPAGQLSAVSTFGEDKGGEVYAAELLSGNIYRLDPPPGC